MGERVGPHQAVFDTAPFYERNPAWSILGKYAWEAIRSLDYLETLDHDRRGRRSHTCDAGLGAGR